MTVWSTVAAVRTELRERLRARPALAGYVLDGLPLTAEDVRGPQGDMVSVYLAPEVEVSVAQAALGVGRVEESYALEVVCQVLARDTGDHLDGQEARCAELVSGVLGAIYDVGVTLDVVELEGWTVRLRSDGYSWRTGRMEQPQGAYSTLAVVPVGVSAWRC